MGVCLEVLVKGGTLALLGLSLNKVMNNKLAPLAQ